MRVGTISVLCTLFSFTFTPRQAAAQSSPATPQAPQVSLEKALYPNKPLQLLTITGEVKNQLPTDPTKKPDPRQAPKIFVLPQDGDIRSADLPPGESPNCAHIIVFQALEMDSPILKEVPKNFSGNMPTVEALPPCSRDFRLAMRARQFPGLFLPRRGPFFQRPFWQFPSAEPASGRPKQNEAPAAKP